MDLTGDPIVVAYLASDSTTASVLYTNKAFSRAFGYAPEDFVDLPAERLHGADFWAAHGRLSDEGDTNENAPLDVVVEVPAADGTLLRADVSVTFVADADRGGCYICAAYRAIGPAGRAETAALPSAPSQDGASADLKFARLAAALDSYPDPIVIYDENLKLVFRNKGYAESMSDNPDEIVEGMHLKDVLHLAIRYDRYPDAVGREEAWVNDILSPDILNSEWQDVELEGVFTTGCAGPARKTATTSSFVSTRRSLSARGGKPWLRRPG